MTRKEQLHCGVRAMSRRLTVVLLGWAVLMASLATSGCERKTPQGGDSVSGKLVIFHAGSLTVPLDELSRAFMKQYPNVTVEMESSGSRACARKVCDLKRECDVLASADYKVIENLLMPNYCDFNIQFALNEMVIAYTDESIHADTIDAQNWPEILLSDGVNVGRSDPDLDPCGYRTLMVFQLAEKHYGIPHLAQKLAAKDKYIRPKEVGLLSLLEVGEIDYLFIYRSVARQHGLRMLPLPDRINLKKQSYSDFYRSATVTLSGNKKSESITRKGEAMVYSVTILRDAPNPVAAQAWVEMLLSETGRAIMDRNGQPAPRPAVTDGFSRLPANLKPLCISLQSVEETVEAEQ